MRPVKRHRNGDQVPRQHWRSSVGGMPLLRPRRGCQVLRPRPAGPYSWLGVVVAQGLRTAMAVCRSEGEHPWMPSTVIVRAAV